MVTGQLGSSRPKLSALIYRVCISLFMGKVSDQDVLDSLDDGGIHYGSHVKLQEYETLLESL